MAIYRGNGGSLDGLTESEVILIAISQGGTGSATVSGARTNLGLGTAATTDASAYATAAQGAKADTATQPGDLATVATTGSYNDLLDLPSAGSGTVTSVGLSAPTGLTVSDSPVTTSGTIALTYTSGYAIPTTAKQTEWDTAYTDRNKWDGGSTGLTASTGRTSLGLGTAATTDATAYATAAQGGKADTAYGWGNHASAGYLTSETYTGTVTSVAMTVPTGLSVSGTPITSTGTLAVTLTAGYSIPTTANQTNWSTAYGWGNHASAGYLTSYTETDPVYLASSWYSTTNNSSNWNTAYGWGNHASAGYALDSAVVKLTGNQTVGGTKTFSSTVTGSISGNAGTVTNGVYTTGDQTIGGTKTFSSTITGSISGNAGTVTNGVYTSGSYADPSWITSLSGTKLTGTVTATNGVVTSGSYSDPSWITSLAGSKISGTIDGGTY